MKTETTTMMTTAAAAAAAVTNWIKEFLCLNRVSKEIRIRTGIKSIYDGTTCPLSMHLTKKEISRQEAATDRFRLQSVCDRPFVVQQAHKMYPVVCTHNSSVFTQQPHLGRTACSALRTARAIFFDLVSFPCAYQGRPSSSFSSSSIGPKGTTTCDAGTDLVGWWGSGSSSRADTAAAARGEA